MDDILIIVSQANDQYVHLIKHNTTSESDEYLHSSRLTQYDVLSRFSLWVVRGGGADLRTALLRLSLRSDSVETSPLQHQYSNYA